MSLEAHSDCAVQTVPTEEAELIVKLQKELEELRDVRTCQASQIMELTKSLEDRTAEIHLLDQDLVALTQSTMKQRSVVDRLLRGSTVVVDPAGGTGAHFASLEDGLSVVYSGCTLLLRPGTYNTPIVLSQLTDVWVRGATDGDVVIACTAAPRGCGALVALTSCQNCRISHLLVRSVNHEVGALHVKGCTDCTAEDCTFASVNLSCVVVASSSAHLQRCIASASQGYGIHWTCGNEKSWGVTGRGSIESCEGHSNTEANLCVEMDAASAVGNSPLNECVLEVLDSHFHHSKSNGIWLRRRCGVVSIKRSLVHHNHLSNIDAIEGAVGEVCDCELHHSSKAGVCVAQRGEVSVLGCKIHSNNLANVAVLEGGKLTLRSSQLYCGSGYGLLARTGASIVLDKKNVIERNLDINMQIENGVEVASVE